ncbi:MAG: hypothetical protein KDC05_04415 [Bacteroidales bacterium]|nr:hypothetical protein [Bacteroidales bacterium]
MKITLVRQRVSYRLTIWGWLTMLSINFLILFLFLRYIATFLVENQPLPTKIMVVDGMMPGYGYDSIVAMVNRESYLYLITTGVDLDYTYNPTEQFNTAEFSYKVLSTKTIENCRLFKAPASRVDRDRTYTAALTLKAWFIQNKIFPGRINVVSFSCHSRRTGILYRKAFRDFAEVGMISVPDNSYDYNQWYKTSKGVRMILSETIGCLYSIIFFHPNGISI